MCVVAPMRWTPALCVVRPLLWIPSSSAVMCVGTVALSFPGRCSGRSRRPGKCVWCGRGIESYRVKSIRTETENGPRPREMHENVMKGALFQHFASPLSLSPREEPRRFPIARRKNAGPPRKPLQTSQKTQKTRGRIRGSLTPALRRRSRRDSSPEAQPGQLACLAFLTRFGLWMKPWPSTSG